MTSGRPVALLLDFDGTAATENVGMALIHKFARDDSWRVIDEDYVNSRVGSRTAYELLGPLLTGGPEEWRAYVLENHSLDPSLAELLRRARSAGWLVEILSDGLDLYIDALLEKAGIEIAVYCASLKKDGDDAGIVWPYLNPLCGRCGTCKAERISDLSKSGYYVIFVGDGFSDLCAAPGADLIFAKDVLADHLREKEVPHRTFATLADLVGPLFGPEEPERK